jgi:hypothetical protein
MVSKMDARTDDDPQPVPPQPPAPGDCCSSGCTFCVEDMYQDELERYRAALKAWRERHPEHTDPAG